MGRWLQSADFPTMDSASAESLIGEAEARVLLRVPCLATLPEASWPTLALILQRVITRWAAQGVRAVKSEATGIYSVTWDTTVAGGEFAPAELADMRALCSSSVSPGLPRGSFPPAYDYRRLFPPS